MSTAPTRILLVEDNPSDRRFIDACLHDGGGPMELHYAARLEEASSCLKLRHYELVIADLNLPDAEGLETFFKVKEMASDSAIVVMTGMDDQHWATQAVLAGAQDYLIKGDMAPQRIRQSVANALQRHGQLRRVSGEAQDLRKKNSSLREMAYTDALTGLMNRRGLAKMLSQASDHRSRPLATHVLLVDVDDFKSINDLFGYNQGDMALKDLGRRIRALLRPTDCAARIGGDEFMVLTSVSDPAEAHSLAEGIRASAPDAGMRATRGSLTMTVSVGLAALERRSNTLEDLIERVQGSLKRGKSGGKNRVCCDEEAPAEGAQTAQAAALRSPFFEIRSGRLAGYRFQDPVEAAGGEPAGSIAAVRDLLKAAARDGQGRECHIELSHTQLLRLHPQDLRIGMDFDFPKPKLCIPGFPMSPLPSGMLEAVRGLQADGWGIGLKDLDLGAHGWANLILLEPAVVTLNPALVKGVAGDQERRRGLLRLSRALACLGAYVVAGGVESSEDKESLDDVGIGFGWGPLWEGVRP